MKKETFRFEYESMRHNVTPAQFLSYIRHQVDKKGGKNLRSDLSLSYFAAGNDLNFDIKHDDPESFNYGTVEKSVSKPYQMQTYIRTADGNVYNEICEFDFWDEKTGTGYYYLLNVTVEEIEDPAEIVNAVSTAVEQTKTRSAWSKGVKRYASELCEELSEAVRCGWVDADDLSNRRLFEKAMLNGAKDWRQYSEGGCSLIWDYDIANRLCNASELKRTAYGAKEPNSRENWIDVQSRALFQAAQMVLNAAF